MMNNQNKDNCDGIFCEVCGDILGNGSNYNLCIDCWFELRYELEEEVFDIQEAQGFVPTNAPLSCQCRSWQK